VARLAILLAALALSACADLALILPDHDTAQMMRGCPSRPPVGECSPAAGAIVLRHRWRF
jgi:hypothetical protein